MRYAMLGLLAETSLHPGAEGTGGVIDLPVAREADKGYPVIHGSSLKGAIRHKAEQLWEDGKLISDVFGAPDQAGGIGITDARLLLLPMRSLTSHYRLVTCPYILERLARDFRLTGMAAPDWVDLNEIEKGKAIAATDDRLYLEEFTFEIIADAKLVGNLALIIEKLIYHDSLKNRLQKQLVIVHDDDFSYFSRYALPVNARNVLDADTKISQNLWYEEVIPADALFYSLLIPRKEHNVYMEDVKNLFYKNPYLQVGGNESIGQGWCVATYIQGGENDENA